MTNANHGTRVVKLCISESCLDVARSKQISFEIKRCSVTVAFAFYFRCHGHYNGSRKSKRKLVFKFSVASLKTLRTEVDAVLRTSSERNGEGMITSLTDLASEFNKGARRESITTVEVYRSFAAIDLDPKCLSCCVCIKVEG
ncbi:hypothetical protein Mapa_018582 [Marchantia paleacea]|nr:hypothetical protein Mapa_018582 [Marchantia paleacea]